ncbi:MAG TPA: hypothetical protein VJK27_10840 [Terriglobales bacterium]|jgi:hypothetical protein|nr:hypothetical protein [Terriglobales bacterium]
MANSTEVITDLHTLAGSTFTGASLTKALVTDDVDLVGMANSASTAGTDLKRKLQLIAANLDGADPALALVNSILGTLT